MAQATNLNPTGLSGPRRCRAPRPAAGGSSRLVPHCGRPAGQISPIASALATSGPAVRGSLTGTPVPQPGSWASARHHDDGDSGDSRAGPRPAGHDDTDAAAAGAPDGLRELPGCQSLGATAVFACIRLYHCHICMYTVCICLYLHVCVCILNDLEKKSLSMKCHIACMLHVCCMYVVS